MVVSVLLVALVCAVLLVRAIRQNAARDSDPRGGVEDLSAGRGDSTTADTAGTSPAIQGDLPPEDGLTSYTTFV